MQIQQYANFLNVYGMLYTSDYKIYASEFTNGGYFICETPGKTFQFYNETVIDNDSQYAIDVTRQY